ncbi:MAG: hypothetical protein AAFO94_12110, partial [Bacteroidota bacterium]
MRFVFLLMAHADLIAFLSAAAAAMSLMLGLAFAWGARRPFVYLALSFFALGYLLLEEYLLLTDSLLLYPWLAEWAAPLTLLIPVGLYFYLTDGTGAQGQSRLALHLVPTLLIAVNFSPLYFRTANFKYHYLYKEMYERLAPDMPTEYLQYRVVWVDEWLVDVLLIGQFLCYAFLI